MEAGSDLVSSDHIDSARRAFYLRDNVIVPYQLSISSIEKVCVL